MVCSTWDNAASTEDRSFPSVSERNMKNNKDWPFPCFVCVEEGELGTKLFIVSRSTSSVDLKFHQSHSWGLMASFTWLRLATSDDVTNQFHLARGLNKVIESQKRRSFHVNILAYNFCYSIIMLRVIFVMNHRLHGGCESPIQTKF